MMQRYYFFLISNKKVWVSDAFFISTNKRGSSFSRGRSSFYDRPDKRGSVLLAFLDKLERLDIL